MQWLLIMILSSDTHRPSSVKLWQIPHAEALPTPPLTCDRCVPLEAQETSYRADSARIFIFSKTLYGIMFFLLT